MENLKMVKNMENVQLLWKSKSLSWISDQNYLNCSGDFTITDSLNYVIDGSELKGEIPTFTHAGADIHLTPEIAFYTKGKAVLAISQNWEKGVEWKYATSICFKSL